MRPTTANDNLHSHVMFIARSPRTCWETFTEPSLFAAWVPGLRRATAIGKRPDGLVREVSFELSASLAYSLVYDYDIEAREVSWSPRTGARDAVRGFARFDLCDGGTLMTYGLEHGPNRRPPSSALEDASTLVAAFKRFVESGRPSSASLRPLDAMNQVNADDQERNAGGKTGEDVRRPMYAEINAR